MNRRELLKAAVAALAVPLLPKIAGAQGTPVVPSVRREYPFMTPAEEKFWLLLKRIPDLPTVYYKNEIPGIDAPATYHDFQTKPLLKRYDFVIQSHKLAFDIVPKPNPEQQDVTLTCSNVTELRLDKDFRPHVARYPSQLVVEIAKGWTCVKVPDAIIDDSPEYLRFRVTSFISVCGNAVKEGRPIDIFDHW